MINEDVLKDICTFPTMCNKHNGPLSICFTLALKHIAEYKLCVARKSRFPGTTNASPLRCYWFVRSRESERVPGFQLWLTESSVPYTDSEATLGSVGTVMVSRQNHLHTGGVDTVVCALCEDSKGVQGRYHSFILLYIFAVGLEVHTLDIILTKISMTGASIACLKVA